MSLLKINPKIFILCTIAVVKTITECFRVTHLHRIKHANKSCKCKSNGKDGLHFHLQKNYKYISPFNTQDVKSNQTTGKLCKRRGYSSHRGIS